MTQIQAAIDQMTAPLVLRDDDGSEKLVAACFPHPMGLLYLDLFWHLKKPDEAAHLIKGELTGKGPWKIGGTVIRVLGCQHTDPHLQNAFSQWRDYLQQNPDAYPPRQQILEIVRRLGATTTET